MYFDPSSMVLRFLFNSVCSVLLQGSEALLINRINHYMNISLTNALSLTEDKKVRQVCFIWSWCALFGTVVVVWWMILMYSGPSPGNFP